MDAHKCLQDSGLDLMLTHSWTKSCDMFLHKCKDMSILKVNVQQVPCCTDWDTLEFGTRMLAASVFILVYNDIREFLRRHWDAPILWFHMDN